MRVEAARHRGLFGSPGGVWDPHMRSREGNCAGFPVRGLGLSFRPYPGSSGFSGSILVNRRGGQGLPWPAWLSCSSPRAGLERVGSGNQTQGEAPSMWARSIYALH